MAFAPLLLMSSLSLKAQTASDPSILPGETAPPVLRSEIKHQSQLLMGATLSIDFDDNAVNDNRNRQSDLVTTIAPHIGWEISTFKTKWTFNYSSGFSASYGSPIYDARSHVLATDLEFRLSKRFQVRMREDFLQSKDAFDRLQESELVTGSSFDHPNGSLTASAGVRSEQAGLDCLYQLTRHSLVGISGAFYDLTYSSLTGLQILGHASSTSGHALYANHISRRNWIGLDYTVQDLLSRTPSSLSLVHSLLFTDTLTISPNTSFTVFAGPEHSRISNAFSLTAGSPSERPWESAWRWSGGASYSWSGERTSVLGRFTRRISDGEPFQGIVQSSNFSAEIKRQVAHRWTAEFLLAYDHNAALIPNTISLSYASIAAGLMRALSSRVSVDVRYWRAYEFTANSLPGSYFADHNRVAISVVYDLKKPLGR